MTDVDRLAYAVGRPQARELPNGLSEEGLVNEILLRLGIDAEDGYGFLAMDRLEERYAWAEQLVTSTTRRMELLAPYRPAGPALRWN
jgi:hypothetical protein